MDICKVYKIILMLSHYVFQNGFLVGLDPDPKFPARWIRIRNIQFRIRNTSSKTTILWIKWKIRKNVPGLFVFLPINDNLRPLKMI
jgi:hypothetical protein